MLFFCTTVNRDNPFSQVLSSWSRCIEGWETGLDCLPPEAEFTQEQKRLKLQTESGLSKVLELEDDEPMPGPAVEEGAPMEIDGSCLTTTRVLIAFSSPFCPFDE